MELRILVAFRNDEVLTLVKKIALHIVILFALQLFVYNKYNIKKQCIKFNILTEYFSSVQFIIDILFSVYW